jgi:4-amino-4-deoxy-L-arabinose transferase-like glycosyltransferase
MIAALTVLAVAIWDRRIDWMAPLAWPAGPLLTLLLVLPWGIAIGLATEWRFYTAAFVNDLAPKLAGQDHAHSGFFGYHALLLPLLIFPATFALPALARLLFAKNQVPADRSALRFLIAWALPAWLVFELSPAKLVHYAMPVYPAIALLCAAGFIAAAQRRWRITLTLGAVLFVLAGALLTGAIGFGLHFIEADPARTLTATMLTALIVALGGAALFSLKSPFARAGAAIACALTLSLTLRGMILPDTRAAHLSADAASALGPLDPIRALWVVGYDEPSIVFLTRTNARLAQADVAGAQAQAGDQVLVERAQWGEFRRALARRGLAFVQQATPVRGLSMSSGDTLALLSGTIERGDAPTHLTMRDD